MDEPFLSDWMSALTADVQFYREIVFDLFEIKFVQAEERIEFEWRGKSG